MVHGRAWRVHIPQNSGILPEKGIAQRRGMSLQAHAAFFFGGFAKVISGNRIMVFAGIPSSFSYTRSILPKTAFSKSKPSSLDISRTTFSSFPSTSTKEFNHGHVSIVTSTPSRSHTSRIFSWNAFAGISHASKKAVAVSKSFTTSSTSYVSLISNPRTSFTVIVTLSDSCRTRPHLLHPGTTREKSNVFLHIKYSGVFNSNPAFLSLSLVASLLIERNVASISFFITAI